MNQDYKQGVKILAISCFGIFVAAIEYLLYTGGVLIDEFVVASETVTIENIMAVTIIVCILIGIAYALATS